MKTFNTLTELICSFDDTTKEGVRFIRNREEERFITYRELYKKALFVLYNLQSKGLRAGDELLFQIKDENNEEFVYIFWACILGKIIPVPVSVVGNDNVMKVFMVWEKLNNPKMITDNKILENINKFASANGLEEKYEAIRQNVMFLNEIMDETGEGKVQYSDPQDIAFIQFSSGSTGDPKGVVLTHKNLITNIEDMRDALKITKGDSLLNWMPLTHDMGLIVCHLTPTICGINHYHIPTSTFIKNTILWFEKVNQYRVTILGTTNFGLRLFLDFLGDKELDWNFDCVRKIMNGAEPISIDITKEFLNRMKKYGLKTNSIYPVYGLAEACAGVAFPSAEDDWEYVYVKRESVGLYKKVIEIEENSGEIGVMFAVEGPNIRRCKLRIVDKNGKVLEEGVIGHIQISGDNVTKGYFNNPEATRKVAREDGWLDTGDLGFLKDGKLINTGRYKDIIFVNGSNYYPHDIEQVCEKVDGISVGKIVVLGLYDEVKQKEKLIVFVVFRKKVESFIPIVIGIKRIIQEHIGIDVDYVIPIKSIPKTTSGKIKRYKLTEMYKNNEFDDVINKIEELEKEQFENRQILNPRNKVEQELVDICKDVFKMDIIGVNDNFKDFGANSLLMTRMHSKIEEIYPSKIQTSDLYSCPTISSLANRIMELNNNSEYIPIASEVLAKDIAIIGMAAKFPMANDIHTFWENIKNGKDCITDFPAGRRRDTGSYLRFMGKEKGVKYAKGGYLEEIDKFDYEFFRMTPNEACLANPSQRLFLETAWEAIEDAGYGGDRLVGSDTGVYVGYIGDVEGYKYKQLIKDVKDGINSTAIPGNLSSIIPSRISYLLNLKGPSMLIDTACSSSLVAVHLACQAIKMGDCQMAIAGGIRLSLLPVESDENIGIESSDGKTRAFDESADGTGLGEGTAAVILKPLDKAVKDGDNIYAVIKGSAVNQDGTTAGITAPNVASQENVIVKAWKNAGINPETITYIEAHGTGTKLGDPIEIDGIQRAFRKYTSMQKFCAIGSVKTNIGHLYEAAGIAGLIKSVLALKNRMLPPSIHYITPNKKINFEVSPVYVNDKLITWDAREAPRRCGISAFGFSGTNCHVILEEFPEVLNDTGEVKGLQVLTLSAKTENSMLRLVNRYREFLNNGVQKDLKNICYTANTARGHYNYRLAFIIDDMEELQKEIENVNLFSAVFNNPSCVFGIHQVIKEQQEERKNNEVTEEQKKELSNTAALKLREFVRTGKQDREVLHQICELYVKGADIKWEDLYEGEKTKIEHIPIYPFERKRCWIEITDIDTDQIYYTVGWKAEEHLLQDGAPRKKSILLFKDSRGVSEKLVQSLQGEGVTVIEVQYGRYFEKIHDYKYIISGTQEDFERLLQETEDMKIGQIIHMLTLVGTEKVNCIPELEDKLRIGVYSLYHLAKAIMKNTQYSGVDMLLVTEYAYEVNGREERINPENAALIGLGRVIGRENPEIKVRCIDVDKNTLASSILDELKAASNSYLTSYRDGQRYVESFMPLKIADFNQSALTFKEDGIYLITGGAGGIGLEIAKRLASKGKLNLALINRSLMPQRDQWLQIVTGTEDMKLVNKIKGIMELESYGNKVECLCADISNEKDLNEVLDSLRQKYGKIRGVIHCAGIPANDFISSHCNDRFRKIMLPKIQGTWLLDKLTRQDEMDFFVLFSSVASIFSSPGRGAYAAANSYLDAFSAYRSKQGKKTLAINWVAWEEVGMAAEEGFTIDTMFKNLPTEKALDAFEEVLNYDVRRLLIGEINYENEVVHLMENYSISLSEEIASNLAGCRSKTTLEKKQKPLTASKEVKIEGKGREGYTDTEMRVAQIYKEVLGFEKINMFDTFFNMGGSSIQLIEAHALLEKEFPGKTSTADLFAHPTVAKLAGFISSKEEPRIDKGKNELLRFTLEESIFSSLKDLASREGLTVYDILLAMYAYELNTMNGQELIRIGVYDPSNNMICPMDIDFSKVGYVEQLFQMVKDKYMNNPLQLKYSGEDSVCINKAENAINTVFILGDTPCRCLESLRDNFNVILHVNELSNKIDCIGEYNSRSISNAKVRNLFDEYIELIQSLTTQAG